MNTNGTNQGGAPMIEGRLVRLRAFEQSDLDANHAFVNDYATLRDMLAGMPLPILRKR